MTSLPSRADDPALWPSDPEEARALQARLAREIRQDPLAAAAVALSLPELEVVDSATAHAAPSVPSLPGLFAFRELPPLLEAVRGLSVEPDVYVCDGFGLAHPRRFGLACHLGWLLDRPAIGVGKSPFVGRAEEPGPERGA